MNPYPEKTKTAKTAKNLADGHGHKVFIAVLSRSRAGGLIS
ncbi:MAG: hypothetical protein QXQ12_07960 [Zestosphaera sp.]